MADKHSLENLLDFKDLSRAKGSLGRQRNEQSTSDSSDNEAILRSFKELRQKLKDCQKDNIILKEQIKIQKIRQKQSQQALQAALSSNIQLKDQAVRDSQAIEELRKKVTQLKCQLDRYSAVDQQLSFTKDALLEARISQKSLLQENTKKTQMFLQERMQLEEEISKLKAKAKSDESFILKLQDQLSRKQEHSIKLQNTMRKMSISYQEDTFNKKWSRQNFETEHLAQIITELQKEVQQLNNKLSSQKQRRFNLEDQLIKLQENAGLTSVKASTFKEETQLLVGKNQKLSKKVDSLKQKLKHISEQKLDLEEQLGKCKLIMQQTSNKLKSLGSKQSAHLIQEIAVNLAKLQKSSSKPPKHLQINHSLYTPKQLNNALNRQPLQQMNSNCQNKVEVQTKKYQSNPQAILGVRDRFTFGLDQNNQTTEQSSIQAKIRKEREEMERRIREKLFHQNIQCSMPNDRYRIRSEYINSFIGK